MTSRPPSLASNTLAVLASGACVHALNFAFGILAARRLGVDQFGLYSFATTVVTLATSLSDLGLSVYVIRAVARDPQLGPAFAGRLLLLRALAVLGCFGAVTAALWFRRSDETVLCFILIAGGAALLAAPAALVSSWFRGTQRMGRDGLLRFGLAAVPLAVSAALLLDGQGILGVATGNLIGSAAVGITVLLLPKPWARPPLPEAAPRPAAPLGAILREAMPFALLTVLVTVSYRIDTVLLEHFRGPREVGFYSAGYRILEVAVLVRGVLPAVFLPVFSDALKRGDVERIGGILRTALKYHIVAGISMALLLNLGSPWLVRWIYGGAGYSESVAPLRILAYAAVAVWISSLTSILISSGPKPGVNTRIAFSMVILNVGLNVLVLPRWGAVGAAAATVATEAAGVLLNTIHIRKNVLPIAYGPALWIGLLCLGLAGAANHFLEAIWLAPAAVAVFVGLLFASRTLHVSEIRMILERLAIRRTAAEIGTAPGER